MPRPSTHCDPLDAVRLLVAWGGRLARQPFALAVAFQPRRGASPLPPAWAGG